MEIIFGGEEEGEMSRVPREGGGEGEMGRVPREVGRRG